jgi:hypothetical protein
MTIDKNQNPIIKSLQTGLSEESKKPWKSITFGANIIAVICLLVQQKTKFIIPVAAQFEILAVINLFIRWLFTKKAIKFK